MRNAGMRDVLHRIFGLIVTSAILTSAIVGSARPQASLSSHPADAMHGKYYALVIGIDRYPEPLPKLVTAVHDAEAIAGLLSTQYGFEVSLLTNGDATRQHILELLNRYERVMTTNDSLLIYYAGHGYENPASSKAYWIPVDADSVFSANRIIADDITAEMAALKARHVLLISDSCYSGGLSRDADVIPLSQGQDGFLRRMMNGRSRTLMASGGDEPVADGGADGHSIFAYALLKALESVDRSVFTASDLFYGGVQRRVAGNSEQLPHYGVIRNSTHDEGDFVFVRKDTSADQERIQLAAGAPLFSRAMALFNAARYLEAAPLLLSACNGGSMRACGVLGFIHEIDDGLQDFKLAFDLYKKSCEGGDAASCVYLGGMYRNGRGTSRNDKEAAAAFARGCNDLEPNGTACGVLGGMYENGLGVAVNKAAAAALYRKSCPLNSGDMCTSLARVSLEKPSGPEDRVVAQEIFLAQCEGKNANACSALGVAYEHGFSGTRDSLRALESYEKGCEGYDQDGCQFLGLMLKENLGIPGDQVFAANVLRSACQKGIRGACSPIAYLLESGTIVATNKDEALKLLDRGCDGYDGDSCLHLGRMLKSGEGATADRAHAAKTLRSACEREIEHACATSTAGRP